MGSLSNDEKAVLKFLCDRKKSKPLAPDEEEIKKAPSLHGIDVTPILKKLESSGDVKSQSAYAPQNCRWYPTDLGERTYEFQQFTDRPNIANKA